MSSKFFKEGSRYAYETLVPKIKKNLTRRRTEFEKTVKNVDDALKPLTPEQKVTAKSKGSIKKTVNKISKIIDEADKKNLDLTEKKAKGGRVGLKRGTNLQKIKKTFGANKKTLGMQSVIYGLDKNPDITKADPKAKFIAAAMKKKKKKVV